MFDLPISYGCDRAGVMFMNDDIDEATQNAINDKANALFEKFMKDFNKFVESKGAKYEMGVICKKGKT